MLLEFTDEAAGAYGKAKEIADDHLPQNSSISLGLVLNFSVFYYEIADDTKMAIDLAKTVSTTKNVIISRYK